jgi:hypothetical protein
MMIMTVAKAMVVTNIIRFIPSMMVPEDEDDDGGVAVVVVGLCPGGVGVGTDDASKISVYI